MISQLSYVSLSQMFGDSAIFQYFVKSVKPWLNMASQGPQSKAQLGPPGYEYTLPGPRFENNN